MASLIGNKSESRYYSFDSRQRTSLPDESSPGRYYPVNVYSTNYNAARAGIVERKLTFYECILRFCCCKSVTDSEQDYVTEDTESALVAPLRKSYNLNRENQRATQPTPTKSAQPLKPDIPGLKVTRVIDDEFCKSSTQLLLCSEQRESSILNPPKYSVKKIVSPKSSSETTPESVPNNNSMLKSGEKVSFIRDILSCRDAFLKSLEWCDNSLTRGKKCRRVKRDEWVEFKSEGLRNH